jgi:hypothetical protein
MTCSALAEATLDFLVQQLKTSDDYRVRTQAALALGKSGSDGAVAPLCEALRDPNLSVDVAAAAALGKLSKPASERCLQDALAKATAPSLKAQIEKSIAAVGQTQMSGSGSSIGPDTRYYVAVQVTNKTTRSEGDIDSLVRVAARNKILGAKGYAVAPKDEMPGAGAQLVKSKKLKGYLLIVTVDPPVYSGGDLTQAVRVSMWTYPGKALQGEFSPKLTQSDTKKGDTQSENDLVKMCVENAVETFLKVAASM